MNKLVLIAEKRPQDCWDWISPEEAARMALLAFEMARKASRPPAGERFRDREGALWAGREDFARNLAYLFELHVKAEAYEMGIGDYATEAARLLLWRGKGRDPVEVGGMASPTPSTTNRLIAGAA